MFRVSAIGVVASALALIAPASASAAVVPLFNQSFEDPQIVFDPDTLPKPTGWIWTGPNGEGTTYERVEDPTAPNGDWVLKVTTDGSEGLGGVHSPSSEVAPNQTHTIQMMVRVPVGRELWPAISERGVEDQQIAFTEGTEYIGTGQWEMVAISRAFGPEGVKTRGYWRLGGDTPATFYLDAVPGYTPPKDPNDPGNGGQPAGPTGPAPVPAAPGFLDTPPTITAFETTRQLFRPVGTGPHKGAHGTVFTYALSEQARVRITITRGKGRHRATVARLHAKQAPGRQSMAFSGRGAKGPLRPGRYRATIVATDAAGQSSRPATTSFRIAGR